MRIAGVVRDSIVDGPGLRLAVFVQGCPHHCPGCHNPGTHDPSGGREADPAEIIAIMYANPLLDGVTFSGGEPFAQPQPLLAIARAARDRALSVWAYSGWTWEQLLAKAATDAAVDGLLRLCDVLVDGRFELELRSLDLKFRGSSNQRIIDVPASFRSGTPVVKNI